MGNPSSYARPLITVVLGDGDATDAVERSLVRRYGSDYEIVADTSTTSALQRLRAYPAAQHRVALLVADHQTRDESGAAFLERAHAVQPTAQRVLLVRWADFDARSAVVRAVVLGQVDHVAIRPAGESDERFHSRISDALARWARETGRWDERLRVVGERWDAHTGGLIDAFRRFGLPFGFHDASSADGLRLLEEAGAAEPLPVVMLPDGRALRCAMLRRLASSSSSARFREVIGCPPKYPVTNADTF